VSPRLLSESDADDLSRLRAWWRSLGQGGLTVSPNGLTLTPGEAAGQAGAWGVERARFRVKTIQNDYLVCRTYDGTTEGSEDINVAKPWDLRRTPFHGVAVNGITCTYSSAIARSATNGSVTESQVITPPYFANCEIWAFKAVGGGTSVTVSSDTLVWQDMNVSGRAWAVSS
jgi:hypothetical protein